MTTFWECTLSGLEATGGHGRAHWLVVLAHNIAGKWGATLVCVIPGLFIAGVGVRNLVVQFSGEE